MSRVVLVSLVILMSLTHGCASTKKELNGRTQGWINQGCITREVIEDSEVYPCFGEKRGLFTAKFKVRFL